MFHSSTSPLPRIIALCGNPGSGKSTAAELLRAHFDYEIVDDALPLRRIAMEHFGCTDTQVFTQAGKLETVPMPNGADMQVRDLLGQIGLAFESQFGQYILPFLAEKRFEPDSRYVLPSVRRDQTVYWAKRQALVVEIVNPLAPVSKYKFDHFNRKPVGHVIHNTGLARDLHPEEARLELLEELRAMLTPVLAETLFNMNDVETA